MRGKAECRCDVNGLPCRDTDIGDGGMCHYCSYVHTGMMTHDEYHAKFSDNPWVF